MAHRALALACALFLFHDGAVARPGDDSQPSSARASEPSEESAQERYQREVAESEAARRAYEEDMRRRQEEMERAQAEYQQRLRDYEADPAVQRARANSCEAQYAVHRERAGRVGRFLGRVVSGVAGDSAGTRFENWVVRVGSLVGERLSNILDCDEQLQVAAATEEAVAGGVGSTVSWTSESRPGVSGSSTVTASQDQSGGGVCLTVTDVVIIDGEETRVPKRLCRTPPSNRFVRVRL